jgi:hypothetical protein
MEPDRAKVALVHTGGDRLGAGRAIASAERLDPAPAAALWQYRVVAAESLGQCLHQRLRDEGHVPGDTDDRRRRAHYRGVDPAERSIPYSRVGNGPKIGPPGRRVGGIRHQKREVAQRAGHDPDQPIQNSLPADHLQSLGPAAEPCCAATCQDCSSYHASLALRR